MRPSWQKTSCDSNSRITLCCSSVERLPIPSRSGPEPFGEPKFEDNSGDPAKEVFIAPSHMRSVVMKTDGVCQKKKSWLKTLESRNQKETCEQRGLILPQGSLGLRWLLRQSGYGRGFSCFLIRLILLYTLRIRLQYNSKQPWRLVYFVVKLLLSLHAYRAMCCRERLRVIVFDKNCNPFF